MRIGVDIGGTKTDVVVVQGERVCARVTVASGHGDEPVLDVVSEAVDSAIAKADATWDDITSVGIGVPGGVADGVVTFALNLGVERLDLAGRLEQRWGLRPTVGNDVNAAALGVLHHGGVGASLAYVNLGTGLAAGIVLDGRLWHGARGVAGEIGHVSVNPSGPADADGIAGCLETYASGSGIARQWGIAGQGAPEVFAAAAAGDPRAAEIVEGLHFGLASAVRLVVLTYDVEAVVIGGGLALAPGVLDGATALLEQWAAASDFLASLSIAARLVQVPADQPFAALGAASLGG